MKNIKSRAGWKTTEFWAGIVTSILVALNQAGVLGIVLPVDGIVTAVTPIIAYIVGRSGLKALAK